MSLDPRAVALQGVGYSPRLLALQGLYPSRRVRLTGGSGGPAPINRSRSLDQDMLLLSVMLSAWSVPREPTA